MACSDISSTKHVCHDMYDTCKNDIFIMMYMTLVVAFLGYFQSMTHDRHEYYDVPDCC